MFNHNDLNERQQRFVDFYDGNGTEAAIKAGYSPKTANQIALMHLKKPKILKAIKKRERARNAPEIASRRERQEFWTKLMKKAEKDGDKLKASELLGKSEADFIERVQTEHEISGNLMAIISKISTERKKSKYKLR